MDDSGGQTFKFGNCYELCKDWVTFQDSPREEFDPTPAQRNRTPHILWRMTRILLKLLLLRLKHQLLGLLEEMPQVDRDNREKKRKSNPLNKKWLPGCETWQHK